MNYEYIYYTTDDSFDFGDFPCSTCYETGYHGFSVDIDKDDNINLNTLEGYGDFAAEIEEVKTLEDLKDFLERNRHCVHNWNWEPDQKYSNEEIFDELEIIVNFNILGKKVA